MGFFSFFKSRKAGKRYQFADSTSADRVSAVCAAIRVQFQLLKGAPPLVQNEVVVDRWLLGYLSGFYDAHCQYGGGTVTFKIKGYASYIDKNTQENKPLPLKVVDSKGKRIDNVPAIAGGSELKVKFFMLPYCWTVVAGASVILQLDSVMLIKLVTPDSADSDDGWANEAVDGGYEDSPREVEKVTAQH